MRDNTNKNFWQKFAGIYTAFMSKNEVAYEAICKELEKYVDSEKKVLELACGTGQITFLMADNLLEAYAFFAFYEALPVMGNVIIGL